MAGTPIFFFFQLSDVDGLTSVLWKNCLRKDVEQCQVTGKLITGFLAVGLTSQVDLCSRTPFLRRLELTRAEVQRFVVLNEEAGG